MKKIVLVLCLSIFLFGCASKEITEIKDTPKEEVNTLYDCANLSNDLKDGAVLLDVRSDVEYNEGHIDNAINISYDEINSFIDSAVPDKNTMIIVYCKSGNRSSQAKATLNKLGYNNVYDIGSINNCN